jgi:perosamine synthetase
MPKDFISLSVPELRGNEWKYLKECLDTNYVSSVGPFVNRFEKLMADYVGVKDAVATVNGTAALHIALLVSGIQPDDEVLVSTLTFIAPVNAIRYAGAWPVFIDAEPEYWQMDVNKVADFLDRCCYWKKGELRNKSTKKRIKAILPVHILGHPVDIDPLKELAQKYNLVIIEDATESLGAQYKGQMVGKLGDIACFSFNGNKIITTGGGGMIVTDNEEWVRKAKYFTSQAKDDPLEYIHCEIGYNYRLTNIQAALGCAQIEVLDEYVEAKRRIGRRYDMAFSELAGVEFMKEAPWAFSVFWMSTALIDEKEYGMGSRNLLRELEKKGIQTRPLWQPIHLSPIYHHLGHTECHVSERICRSAISLPCSVGLEARDQERVISALNACKAANRTEGKAKLP